jgi:hypothetical protein
LFGLRGQDMTSCVAQNPAVVDRVACDGEFATRSQTLTGTGTLRILGEGDRKPDR